MTVKTKSTATDRFIAQKSEIDALLAEIATASENHFGRDPDAVHWGDVGSLAEAVKLLREAARMVRP